MVNGALITLLWWSRTAVSVLMALDVKIPSAPSDLWSGQAVQNKLHSKVQVLYSREMFFHSKNFSHTITKTLF